MRCTPKRFWKTAKALIPRAGDAGSRSSHLHVEEPSPSFLGFHDPTPVTANPTQISSLVSTATGADLDAPKMRYADLRRFAMLRWMGTVGALILGLGGLGAGALPVVHNPYGHFPGGQLMARMLQTSTMLCFIGIGLLVVAWVFLAPYTGALIHRNQRHTGVISLSLLRRTFLAWSLPILCSAPMFTQDIYSYLANGKILRLGLDPYSAGPLDLLPPDDPLARSVPFIWAYSPSPYGPVALGVAKAISFMTNDHIAMSVFLHRSISLAGVALAGWAIVQLARRCRVRPQAALWLGLLNPLSILHLIGGIHNEAILLGLLLAGMELGLRGVDATNVGYWSRAVLFLGASGALISCAGMVKVSAFIGLGFIGMALARSLHARGHSTIKALCIAVTTQLVLLICSVALATLATGVNLGWITSQGGAVAIRSWMSTSTSIGVISGWFGMMLGLGDHTETILEVTRAVGIMIAAIFIIRMLWATFRGRIAAIGGLGVATFVMVLLFPVVHPWYVLWAIFPLAAWANRLIFRFSVLAYSVIVSFFVLPRGLGLPPLTVLSIYVGSAIGFIAILAIMRWGFHKRALRHLN